MLYFAYGSNINWAQMQERCPSAKLVTIAELPDHRLAFSRFSRGRGCGVADVVPAPGEAVWGVVYEITEADLVALDRKEGFDPRREKNSYHQVSRVVCPKADPTRPLQVVIYLAVPQVGVHRPSREYMELIISGARHWGLPEEYIQALGKIEVGSVEGK